MAKAAKKLAKDVVRCGSMWFDVVRCGSDVVRTWFRVAPFVSIV